LTKYESRRKFSIEIKNNKINKKRIRNPRIKIIQSIINIIKKATMKTSIERLVENKIKYQKF
jgi:hypothetical protein